MMENFNYKKSLDEINSSISIENKSNKFKKIISFLGPAYLIGVGYIDPGNWATDLASGSLFGYKLIWVLIISNIIALYMQHLSARIGIVKGMDLAQLSKYIYSYYINIILYVLAELSIIATDLSEVIGMAIGLKLLFGIPIYIGIFITLFDTLLILIFFNKNVRLMELFIILMISITGISLFLQVFLSKPDIKEIILGIVPSKLNYDSLYISIGIIGATVMPHNLYLHSSLVQTRIVIKDYKHIKEAIKYNLIDTTIALNIAFFINMSIMILSASIFFKNNIYVDSIESAYYLINQLGYFAPILFAIALIASGQSSTITGTLAGQIIMEGYLNIKIRPWIRRLITRSFAILPSLFIIIYFGENYINQLLIFSQVILSLQLGFAIIPLIYINSSYDLMKKFTINKWQILMSYFLSSIIIFFNISLIIMNIMTFNYNTKIYCFILILMIFSILFMVYILLYPFFKKIKPKQ
ncbi:MAG: Nramp family divalent metal transporter [Bacteroides sp.]|nr:MAG: Nramp family divalent metal transporter [Bacteroides sp.]